MRLFIRERRALARMVPHLVRPLPFCVPTYVIRRAARRRCARRSPSPMRSARDRNDGIDDPALRLPGGRIVSRDECLALNPAHRSAGVTGGAVWHDYQMRQTERVTSVGRAVGGGRRRGRRQLRRGAAAWCATARRVAGVRSRTVGPATLRHPGDGGAQRRRPVGWRAWLTR